MYYCVVYVAVCKWVDFSVSLFFVWCCLLVVGLLWSGYYKREFVNSVCSLWLLEVAVRRSLISTKWIQSGVMYDHEEC